MFKKMCFLIAVLTVSLATSGFSAAAADRTGAVAPDGSIKDTVLSTLYYTPDIKAFQEYRKQRNTM